VGRGDIKHTSSKAIITFYTHNSEQKYLSRALQKLYKVLFEPKKELKTFVKFNKKGSRVPLTFYRNKPLSKEEIIKYNENGAAICTLYLKRALTLEEIEEIKKNATVTITTSRPLTLLEYFSQVENSKTQLYFQPFKQYFVRRIDYNNLKLKLIISQHRLLNIAAKAQLLSQGFVNNYFIILCSQALTISDYKKYLRRVSNGYLSVFNKFRKLLVFNKNKFSKAFMFKFTGLVEKLYDKKVEFNVVNLKEMHFNSDIFTQLVSLKLRNRDNKLYRVLKSSLRKVRLPKDDRREKRTKRGDKNLFIVNRIRNNYIESMFNNNEISDPLNDLLLQFFP